MPKQERFSKRTANSTFGRIVRAAVDSGKSVLNATDFIESSQGLGIKLYPAQRTIVKVMFGVPLDYKPVVVPMWDKFHSKLEREVSEIEFLHILHDQGRCNVDNWQDLSSDGYNEGCFIVGRRGGKSQVVSAMAGYALYQLLNIFSPQEFWQLVPGSPIDFTFLSADDLGANRLFEKMKEDINRGPFFTPYLRTLSNESMKFVSESDRQKRDVTPTIKVQSFACTTTAVRGPSSLFLAFDEFAHFRSEKGSTSDEVYAAATPSTTQFSHKETINGETTDVIDRLILSISSPWKKVGKMYDLHKMALEQGADSKIFTLRLSTAEMNHRITEEVLRDEYDKNSLTWKAEFGGEFLESSETYVTEAALKSCVDCQWDEKGENPIAGTARENLVAFNTTSIGRQFFWWIDLGLDHDATAVAIAHLESTGATGIKLVFDYIDRMMVGEEFEFPRWIHDPLLTNKKYVGYRSLPVEDVVAWLARLNEAMPCFKGGTDQYGGQLLIQFLELNQIHNVELINLTSAINSQMAFTLKGYIDRGSVSFPYVPKYLHEMKMVEAQYTNKYQVRVEAPLEKDSHDDMSDATQGCAYLALKWLNEEGRMTLDPSGLSLVMQEQMFKNPAPIMSVDAVSIQDLRILDRQHKVLMQSQMGGGIPVKNPFMHRSVGRRGRR
jgi:hypothetical protein